MLVDGGRTARCAVVVLVALVLAGCSSRSPVHQPPAADPSQLGLTGPWAQDFADAMASSTSDYERKVLADGRVTDSELADAHHHVDACLRDSGYTIRYARDGGFDVDKLGRGSASDDMTRTNRVLEGCEARWDSSITMLFEETRRNPQKRDEAAINVACLRKAGVVPKSYSERDWRAENDKGVYSFDEYSAEATQCRLDPLGLWRDE
ncbi:MAG: hypothetical protein INR72_14790 [Williamsia herbipolensis]|nr:hypothetical protein [Williamsia herbipolensis]